MMDDFDIPGRLIPSGSSYQWADKEFLPTCLENGWKMVPFDRHKDFFPDKHRKTIDDSINVHGLTLIEKPKGEVQVELDAVVDRAIKQETNQLDKIAGFFAEQNETEGVHVKASISITNGAEPVTNLQMSKERPRLEQK